MKLLSILSCTLFLFPAAAGDKAPKDKDVKWTPLLDGKSLGNFKSTNFGGENEVLVEKGVLIMEMGSDMTGITYQKDDFPRTNYEVEIEAKKIRGNDFFCTTTFPVGKDHCSLVVGGWGGPVVGLSSINGKDASENETKSLQDFKHDRWYKIRIRVTDDRIGAWIDDNQVVDLKTRDKKISLRPECDPCRPFGIATWRTVGGVKSIQVRTLAP